MRLKETDAERLTRCLEGAIMERGWTVKQAAKEAGTTSSHFYRILKGEANPTLSRLLYISRRWRYRNLLKHLTPKD